MTLEQTPGEPHKEYQQEQTSLHSQVQTEYNWKDMIWPMTEQYFSLGLESCQGDLGEWYDQLYQMLQKDLKEQEEMLVLCH